MRAPVWDEGLAPAWPPLDGPVAADAVVVGLGASGLAAIEELHRRGLTTVGVDRDRVGGGAAGRNGGLLLGGLAMFHHHAVTVLGRERAADAYRATLVELDRTAARWPDLVRRTGSVRLAGSDEEAADCEAHLLALQADGIDAERHDGHDGTGLVLGHDATIQPLARCRDHAAELSAAGASLHEHTEAQRIESGRVTTPVGAIDASVVVVCVDGGLEQIVPALTGRVRTTRLQMLATGPARDVVLDRPVYSRWGYDYWQQLVDGRLAVGGGRDLHEAAEWGAPADPSADVQRHLDRLLRETIGTTAEVTHRWAGVVAYTDNRLPVIAQVASGVAVAGAYSGHGNLIGPMAGRAAVELLLDGRSRMADLLTAPPSGA